MFHLVVEMRRNITSIEGAIVRDADRLDAIGAIGIARTFAFGGARGRKLYDTDEMVRVNMSEAEYRARKLHQLPISMKNYCC